MTSQQTAAQIVADAGLVYERHQGDGAWTEMEEFYKQAIATAIRHAINECVAIANKEADLLLFTGERLRCFHQATRLHYSEAELHDQAGTVLRAIAEKMDALKQAATPAEQTTENDG